MAVIHAPIADWIGNSRLGGNHAVDSDLALIADRVIITAEEIVDQLDAPMDITGLCVTAVVHVPNGAWPTSCYPNYALDGEEILRYSDACAAENFDAYLTEWLSR